MVSGHSLSRFELRFCVRCNARERTHIDGQCQVCRAVDRFAHPSWPAISDEADR